MPSARNKRPRVSSRTGVRVFRTAHRVLLDPLVLRLLVTAPRRRSTGICMTTVRSVSAVLRLIWLRRVVLK